MSKISLAIPCHDRGENGPLWLDELFQSIKSQTFQDIDIVISDQSENDLILDKCKEWNDHFEFTYVRYEGSTPCDNINTALENCTGDITKIIFSDDVFTTNIALDTINQVLENFDNDWLFTGYCETDDGKNFYSLKRPKWVKETLIGRNLLSSPSGVAFKTECGVKFDPNLKLLLDVDFYHNMRIKNGLPALVPEVFYANRNHTNRVSSQSTSQYDCTIQHPEGNWMMNHSEYEYITEKYKEFFANDMRYPDEN